MPGRLPRGALAVITDDRMTPGAIVEAVEAACDGGCHVVQLRHRDRDGREVYALAERLREITRRHGALFVVNDRADIALAVQADGLHLPTRGLGPAEARRLLGADRLLGVSVHDPSEIESLPPNTVDYVQFGPVYATPSKARFGAPQGLDRLRVAADATHARAGAALVAVGGIAPANVGAVIAAGADAVAVIGAVMGSDAPRRASAELCSKLNDAASHVGGR